MEDALDWFWGVLQGDFNEDPSLSQTVVGAVVTAIPIIDQIADIRDVIANLGKVSKDVEDKWAWVALVITLIGLIPVLGSLLKGVFKIVAKAARTGAKHLDDALEMVLAIIRGAGKGDPVRYLKNLPIGDHTRQVVKHFNEIIDKLIFGISDVRHSWLAKTFFSEKAKRLELVEQQILKLKAKGQEKIPEVMTFLKAELDKLLARVKPAKVDGTTDTANTLAHSSKPLLRLEYEVVVRRRVGGLVESMKKAGKSEEEIARAANAERRQIGKEIKDRTDPELREIIYRRNREKYGDELGPKYEDFKRGYARNKDTGEQVKIRSGKGATDAEIIESAQRTGGDEFPWEKIMEYSREKKTGDPAKAAELLKEIDRIVKEMNKTK